MRGGGEFADSFRDLQRDMMFLNHCDGSFTLKCVLKKEEHRTVA